MITVGPPRRTRTGQVVIPVYDEKLRRYWVYVPMAASSGADSSETIDHLMATRRGPVPPEDFTRGG